MEKCYYRNTATYSPVPDIKIRYGQESAAKDVWKKIVNAKNKQTQMAMVDKLLELMEVDKESNGFFGLNDGVECSSTRGFLLNDRELYYMFFENLQNIRTNNPEYTDGLQINKAIQQTIKDYNFGEKKYEYNISYNTTDKETQKRTLRQLLTQGERDEDYNIVYPSIDRQKGQGCLLCTEQSAIAHNLWLLTGVTSYYCYTNCDSLGQAEDCYKNDAHNFTIVEYDGKFRLYDLSLQNICMLDNDCIENLLSGKGLKVQNVVTPGAYAPNDFEIDVTKQ